MGGVPEDILPFPGSPLLLFPSFYLVRCHHSFSQSLFPFPVQISCTFPLPLPLPPPLSSFPSPFLLHLSPPPSPPPSSCAFPFLFTPSPPSPSLSPSSCSFLFPPPCIPFVNRPRLVWDKLCTSSMHLLVFIFLDSPSWRSRIEDSGMQGRITNVKKRKG